MDPRVRAVLILAVALLSTIIFSGSLEGDRTTGVIEFGLVRQVHFDALRTEVARGPSSSAPLHVRLTAVGDGAAERDFSRAEAYLSRELNVRVEWVGGGLPVFITKQDLAAKSGSATLGATISTGIAIEARDSGIADCVFAHEIGHFLGLGHRAESDALMSEHCTRRKLHSATVSAEEMGVVASISEIRAFTLVTSSLWAYRG